MADIGLFAQLACIWEATARKAGNVHRYQDFSDTSYLDFLVSAAAVAPVLGQAPARRVGETILSAVQATRRVAAVNTNLGILLLLAPLAAVPVGEELRPGLGRVLAGLDVADARAVYEAIRLAQPGGLGRADSQDVRDEPTVTLRQAMALAADRDQVARQYANGFREVFAEGVPAVQAGVARTGSLESAIQYAQLVWLTNHPDSLIARKLGPGEAAEACRRAARVLELDWPHTAAAWDAWHGFDAWLREGKGRNPGTTADLLAACLFVALREGILALPGQVPWARGGSQAGAL
jgi:triphosphoribosyl-dephospho-CoA synthase